jgi:amino acid transporter
VLQLTTGLVELTSSSFRVQMPPIASYSENVCFLPQSDPTLTDLTSDVLRALALTPNRWNTRFVAFICLTACLFVHGIFLNWGLRVQNALGMFKLGMLCIIALMGLLCLANIPGFQVREGYEVPHNLKWSEMWEGNGTSANLLINGLYSVIWSAIYSLRKQTLMSSFGFRSFVGYSNGNYALSEVKDPVRTIKRAGPLAIMSITFIYFLVNIAYFAVVSKNDILSSRQIIA